MCILKEKGSSRDLWMVKTSLLPKEVLLQTLFYKKILCFWVLHRTFNGFLKKDKPKNPSKVLNNNVHSWRKGFFRGFLFFIFKSTVLSKGLLLETCSQKGKCCCRIPYATFKDFIERQAEEPLKVLNNTLIVGSTNISPERQDKKNFRVLNNHDWHDWHD